MLFIFVIHWAFCCCDFCCSCVLTFGKNSCDLKEKRKKSAKREVYTHVYTFCHWECERGKENEQNRVKVPKIWKIILFSEEKKKWQKNCRIIIYTFLLYKFSWVLFSQRSFANHLCDCYRLSFDSYTISTFTSFFFLNVICFKYSFISFDKDEIETEEHLSMDFTMVLPLIVCYIWICFTTLQTVFSSFLFE